MEKLCSKCITAELRKAVPWWSAPGLKFAYTGNAVAISFGNHTDPGVLLAWRIDGQDWLFANVTPSATYQFVNAQTTGQNLTNSGTTGQVWHRWKLYSHAKDGADTDFRVQSDELVK